MRPTYAAAAAALTLSLTTFAGPAFADATATPAPGPTATGTPVTIENLSGEAVNDTATVVSGGTVTVDVLANDNLAGGTARIEIVPGDPSHGTASVTADNQVTYTAEAGYIGKDYVNYNVVDADPAIGGVVSHGTLTIRVTAPATDPGTPPTPDTKVAAPGALRDDAFVNIDSSVQVLDVTSNDGLTAEQKAALADGRLSVVIPDFGNEIGKLGTVAVTGSAITFTPKDGVSGTGSFLYSVRDANGAGTSANVTVVVDPHFNRPDANGFLPWDPRVQLKVAVQGTTSTLDGTVTGPLAPDADHPNESKLPTVASYVGAYVVADTGCDVLDDLGAKITGDETVAEARVDADGQVSIDWGSTYAGNWDLVVIARGADGQLYQQVVDYGRVVPAPVAYGTGRVPLSAVAGTELGGNGSYGPHAVCAYSAHKITVALDPKTPTPHETAPPTGDAQPRPTLPNTGGDATGWLAALGALTGLGALGLGGAGLRRRKVRA